MRLTTYLLEEKEKETNDFGCVALFQTRLHGKTFEDVHQGVVNTESECLVLSHQ